jgi:uncharacterized protein (TIGR00251 family)
MALELRDAAGGLSLRVRVKPRAARDALVGEVDGELVVALKARPVDGAANAALARFLGQALAVPPSAVRIVAGATGRHKRVAVAGIDAATARVRLGG